MVATVAVVLFAGLAWVAHHSWQLSGKFDRLERLESAHRDNVSSLASTVQTLSNLPLGAAAYDDSWVRDEMTNLLVAVAEGIEHVDRSERRVRAVLQSAKRRFEAEGYVDPGVEAETAALPPLDASSQPAKELQPVPDGVAEPNPWAGVPGMRL